MIIEGEGGIAIGSRRTGSAWALGASALIMSTMMVSAPVNAQTAAAPEEATSSSNEGLGEIIVTARNRAENVQDVPIAITVLTGNSLAERGITRVTDLRGNVPSLSTEATGGPNSAFPNFGIRGQRSDSYFILQSPTVITYFADAPQGHPVGFGENLYDIASVQVLKGPQGTLFGVNATGGAILVQPNKPSRKFEGAANASYGNYNEVVVGGMLNLPISDFASFRVAGQYHRNDGWMKNITNGKRLARADSFSIRPSLLLSNDRITSLTTFDYFQDKGAPIGNVLTYVNPGPSLLFAQPPKLAEALAAFGRTKARTGSDRWSIESPAGTGTQGDVFGRPEQQTIRNWGVTNDMTLKLNDNLSVRNILSYRRVTADVDVHFASVPIYLISVADYVQKSRQISEELQLLGKAFDGRLDYVVGGFFRKEKGFDDATSALVNGARLQNSGGGTTTNYSTFAQASFKITDQLSLTGGVRYNYDKIYGYSDSLVLAGMSPLIPKASRAPRSCNLGTLNGATLVRFPLTACKLDGNVSFKKPTWLASVEYRVPDGVLPATSGTLLYATVRRGYRAGGFNVRATAYPLFGPYRPETITDFETGFKSDWDMGGSKLRTNVAFFYDKLKDLQRSVSIPVPGSAQPLSTVTNAARSTVYGMELEATVIPVPALEVSGYYNYLHNKYDSYISTSPTGAPVDLSGRPFRASPRNKYAINGRYTLSMGSKGSELAFSANYVWQDDSKLSEVADPAGLIYTQKAYGVLNGRIDFSNIAGSNISAGAYIRNATDKFYATGYSDLSASNGISVITPGEPRTYGVDMRVEF